MSGRGLIIFDGFCATQAVLSPAAVSANTTNEQTFSFPGVLPNDIVMELSKNSAQQAGLFIVNNRVPSANNITIQFANITSASITPTSATTYTCLVFRPEKAPGTPDGLSGGNVIF